MDVLRETAYVGGTSWVASHKFHKAGEGSDYFLAKHTSSAYGKGVNAKLVGTEGPPYAMSFEMEFDRGLVTEVDFHTDPPNFPSILEMDYDSLDRLSGASQTSPGMFSPNGTPVESRTLVLDKAGNRTGQEFFDNSSTGSPPTPGPVATTTYMPEATNRYASVIDFVDRARRDTPPYDSDFVHDANGNITGIDGRSATFQWDFRNQLVGASEGDVTVAYKRDALGRAISRTVDDGQMVAVTRFIYDGWRVIEERDEADDVVASYVVGLGPCDLVSMSRDGQDYYYVQNDRHDVIALVDGDGEVVERTIYDEFGAPYFLNMDTDEYGSVSAIGNPYGFGGTRWEAEIKVYDHRLRLYDPTLGRFLSVDPIGEWGDPLNMGNGYAFAGNNPWTWLDPYGLDTQGKPAGAGAEPSLGDPYIDGLANQKAAGVQAGYAAVAGLETGVNVVADFIPGTGDVKAIADGATSIAGNPSLANIGRNTIGTAVGVLIGQKGGEIVASTGRRVQREVSSWAARRAAMPAKKIPTSQTAKEVICSRKAPGDKQFVYKDSDGKDVTVTHHSGDETHPYPHWEAGYPKSGGQVDPLGRYRYGSDKAVVEYEESN